MRISLSEFIINVSNNLFSRYHLIIVVGRHGLNIYSIEKGAIVENVFVNYKDKKYYFVHRGLINKYKKSRMILLLADDACQLKQETVPDYASILKHHNTMQEFVAQNYSPETIVAYNMYTVNHDDKDLNLCIVSCVPSNELRTIIEYITKKSYKYGGVYFLSLEMINIINQIVQSNGKKEFAEYLQLLVTMTLVSGLRIVVKHKNNIIRDQILEYPQDKSDLYIQGTIEQVIIDILLYYKGYIKSLGLKVCIIYLLDDALKALCSKINFTASCPFIPKVYQISTDRTQAENRFQDVELIKLFNNNAVYLGSNKVLRDIVRFTLINTMIFKLIMTVTVVLGLALGILKYQISMMKWQTEKLNDRYYERMQNYGDVKNDYHHGPVNSGDSMMLGQYDLSNASTIMLPQSLLEYIKSIIATQNSSLLVKKLSWQINRLVLYDLADNEFQAILEIQHEYTTADNKLLLPKDELKLLEQYVQNLKELLPNYQVQYNPNDNTLLNKANKVVVVANVVISGKAGM